MGAGGAGSGAVTFGAGGFGKGVGAFFGLGKGVEAFLGLGIGFFCAALTTFLRAGAFFAFGGAFFWGAGFGGGGGLSCTVVTAILFGRRTLSISRLERAIKATKRWIDKMISHVFFLVMI